MKKISTLFFILISLVAFSENPNSTGLQNKVPIAIGVKARNFEISKKYPARLSRTPHSAKASSSRSQNITFYMDYGLLDSFYNVYGPNNGGGTWYRDDQYSFRLINSSLPVDSVDYQKYGFTWFPQIIDFVNNPDWPFNNYEPSKIAMTIDTVYVTLGHVHTSNLNDTITVSIWDLDSFGEFVFDSGAAGGGTTLLGQTQVIVDSSILGGTGQGTTPGTFELGTFPFDFSKTPVVVPTGHRFIIQLNFNGPYQDEFLLSSTRRNDCASTCGASIPYVNATFGSPSSDIDSFNSLYGIRYAAGGDTGVFPSTYFYNDCNGNGVKDACEQLYTQDFDIFPNINATITQFYVAGGASGQNICPNTNVNLTAYGGGSSATPYMYSWVTTSGQLSNTSGQQTTLTTGTTAVNDTVIVTLTDANSQTTKDTFVVTSGGIGVRITNPTQPINLTCGQKAIITTQVSGSILGKQYSWNTGQAGIAASTITDSVAGVFTVTVTNSIGCSATASVTVNYTGTTNSVSFEQPNQQGQHQWANCPLTFKNTSSSFEAPWVATLDPLGNGSDDVNVYDGNANIPYTYQNPGVYSVILTMDSAGCIFSQTQTVEVTSIPNGQQCTVGVIDLAFSDNISMMPNPTNGYLHINVNGVQNNITVKIYNILGAEVKTFQANEIPSGVYSKDFDLTAMPSGTYLVRIDSGDQTAVKKLIISR